MASVNEDKNFLFSDSDEDEPAVVEQKVKAKPKVEKKTRRKKKIDPKKVNAMTRGFSDSDDDSDEDEPVVVEKKVKVKAKPKVEKKKKKEARVVYGKREDFEPKNEKKKAKDKPKVENKAPDRYFELQETFDADKLNFICKNFKKFKPQLRWRERYDEIDPLKIIKAYLHRSRNGTIRVNYRQKNSEGRYFAISSMSLQNIPREIRHAISKEFYVDIDMVNCHPVIFSYLAHEQDFACPKLDYYINNREKVLSSIMMGGKLASRDTAKQLFLSILNGGYLAYSKVDFPTQFLVDFKTEVDRLHGQFRKLYPVRYQINKEKRLAEGENFNHRGSFVNKLFCDFENKILMTMYEFFGKPADAVLCFDGIMLKQGIDYDIAGCMAAITEKLKIVMKIKTKPMNEQLDLSEFNIEPYHYFDLKYFADFDKMLNNAAIHEYKDGTTDKFIYPEWADEWVNNALSLLTRGGEQVFITLNSNIDMATKEVSIFHVMVKKQHILSTLDVSCNIKNYKAKKGESLFNFQLLGPNVLMKSGYVAHCLSERKLPIFNNLMFYPYLKRKGIPDVHNHLNLFGGFPLEEIQEEKKHNFEDSLLYKHLKEEFFNNDPAELKHFLDHVADTIQCPNKVRGVAHLFYSKQGTGKGLLSKFMMRMLGKENHIVIKDLGRYMEKFNLSYSSKLLKVFEELPEKGGAFTHSQKLKGQIDQETENVEPKGFKMYEIAHYARFWFFTNNENTLYVEGSDRRYTLHKINGQYANNKKYFAPIWAEIEDEQFLRSAFEYFATREYDIIDTMTAFNTQYKREQKQKNLPKAVKFIIEHIEKTYKELDNEQAFIPVKHMANLYKEWCEDGYGKFHKGSMLTQLAYISLIPKRVSVEGKRLLSFPFNLTEVEKGIQEYLKDKEFKFDFEAYEC
jgi:hypothetical protein